GYKELMKKIGAFLVPGLAKFVVIKKPATKARKGINPSPRSPQYSRRSRLVKSSRRVRSRQPRTRYNRLCDGAAAPISYFFALPTPPGVARQQRQDHVRSPVPRAITPGPAAPGARPVKQCLLRKL